MLPIRNVIYTRLADEAKHKDNIIFRFRYD